MSGKSEINKRTISYLRQSYLMFGLLTAAGLGYMLYFDQQTPILTSIVVSVCYAFVLETADALVWRKIAIGNPDYLPQYFLGFQAARMFSALALMGILYAVVEEFMTYLVVFAIYYFLLLLHHTLFFANNK